jgi:glycine cleavage system H protein
MEQFTYTDIFDTKGIEYIIVILFFLLIIPFWRLLNRPPSLRKQAGELFQAITLQALKVPQGLLFDRNHTWSHLEKSGVASVGMDDLLLHLTGGVDLQYLKDKNEKVKRGEPIARITREGKDLLITSPLSGEIDSLHTSLQETGFGADQDPYDGWFCRIRPEFWKQETSEALLAQQATAWTARELDRIKDYLAGALDNDAGSAPVLQAGGELSGHPLQELGPDAWQDFQEKFLCLEA